MAVQNSSRMMSSDGGAPIMYGTAGKGLAFLQAILLNGYNWQSIAASAITVTTNTATSTMTATLANCGFNNYQRLMMVGMDQAAFLNGRTYGDLLYPTVNANGGTFTALIGSATNTVATTGGGAGGTTTTLSATCSTTAQSTITIASAAHLPSAIPFVILIDSEWMLVTAGMGTTTLTVTRGFGASTAATHASGATVTQVILVGVAPAGGWLGWTQPYSGTNLGDFRAANGNQMYLDVDDNTSAQYMRVRGYQTMSAQSTGLQPFPTVGQVAAGSFNFQKSNTADGTTARPWVALVSGTFIHVNVDVQSGGGSQNQSGIFHFGDLISQSKSGDAFATIAIAETGTGAGSSADWSLFSLSATTNHYLAASYTQLGGSIGFGKYALDVRSGGGANFTAAGGLAYPHQPDGGLYLSQVGVWESATVWRGVIPGIWDIMHSIKIGANYDVWVGSGPFAGKTFMAVSCYNGLQYALEISNTISAT